MRNFVVIFILQTRARIGAAIYVNCPHMFSIFFVFLSLFILYYVSSLICVFLSDITLANVTKVTSISTVIIVTLNFPLLHLNKVLELAGEGSVINGAYPV